MATVTQSKLREWHPYAKLFPLLSQEQLEALAADIAENGQREPIIVDRLNRVLDGRNRSAACRLAGVEPDFKEFLGSDADALKLVISLNVHRRHLDESQRAMIAAEIANLQVGSNQHEPEGTQICAPSAAVSVAEAADALSVSPRSVTSARKVKAKGIEELQSAVVEGSVSVSKAAQIADLPVELQPAAVIEAKKPHVSNNSGDNEWYTPLEFIVSARAVMGAIDLDPASSEVANATVQATRFFTAQDDGLQQAWCGRVWLNPPYAQPLMGKFAEAVASKYESEEVTQACVLVNNATETVWFQRMLSVSDAVCFTKGRIRFLDPAGMPSGSPLQGQAVLYFGSATNKFVEQFARHGTCLTRCSR